MHVLPYVSRNSSTSLIKRQNYSNLGRFNIATDDISSVLRKFLFYLLPDFTPSREHPFVLFLTAQIFDNSSRHLTKKHPRRGYRAKCLVSSESIRRIRNGARYRVKKTLSHTEELWARESFPFRDGETGGGTQGEKRRREPRDHRAIHYLCHPAFRSQCGSTKSKCIAYANAGRAPVVSVGVNSQSASGNNHNDQ